jgi:hypothetical protein
MIRGTLFIEVVLKKMIDLKHYWGRVEFAPGRGQIHLHILAIMKDKAYLHRFYDAKTDDNKISVLQTYATGTLGMTSDINVKDNPSSQDIKNAKHNLTACYHEKYRFPRQERILETFGEINPTQE